MMTLEEFFNMVDESKDDDSPRKHYIYHEDKQTPENGWALFGPFSDEEFSERLNDSFADTMASYGDLDAVDLTDEQAEEFYINPRDFWMKQVSELDEDVKPYRSIVKPYSTVVKRVVRNGKPFTVTTKYYNPPSPSYSQETRPCNEGE